MKYLRIRRMEPVCDTDYIMEATTRRVLYVFFGKYVKVGYTAFWEMPGTYTRGHAVIACTEVTEL